MPKIHTLKICNFRGIKNFEQCFADEDFICILGRGDSGKTTILEAISIVLSPNWNLVFTDADFYDGDIEHVILIEASLSEPPEDLLRDHKFGNYLRGVDPENGIISDEIQDEHVDAITIRLTVTRDLEPLWEVICDRHDPAEIKSSDRAKFNVFLVSDYLDKHFSWNKGNPLYSLFKQGEEEAQNKNIIIDEMRSAKIHIDSSTGFSYLNETTGKVQEAAAFLGANISSAKTTIDVRDLNIKDGKVCLHDDKIPFRLKGKGSKRLISIAIQTELMKHGGILLIDEIEQGLEPDRAQHLSNVLKNSNNGQVFITTHSRDVLVELKAHNLFRMKNGGSALYHFDSEMQGCLRSNPEAFFADRVIVCEGPTEVGFLRALNAFRKNNGKESIALKGIRLANGNGSSQIEYAERFNKAGYDVCIFCDSDLMEVNDKKLGLKAQGIKIIDTEVNNALEYQIFSDLNWKGVLELLEYRKLERTEAEIIAQVSKYHSGAFPLDGFANDTASLRIALGKASTEGKQAWFKRTDHGEKIGAICCENMNDFTGTHLHDQLVQLNKWIDNV
ncbi:ATP-dependent nuclease [Pedobacter suwonensis]|uniref:ATP-dependent nuclease n=1 Tax=Pedobacter suwonensis TaxID=332999 RepID=UPI00369C5B53